MTPEQIELYKSLFQVRNDVYERRWEKDTKNGWSPAYGFDWNEFNATSNYIKDALPSIFKPNPSFNCL